MRKGKDVKTGTRELEGKVYDVYSNTVDVENAVKEDPGFAFYMSRDQELEAVICVPSNTPGFGKVFFRKKGSKDNVNLPTSRFKYQRRRFRVPKITWVHSGSPTLG